MSEVPISVGDYVIVQEGQIDQPKIVVWDDVTVVDVFGEISTDLLIAVFDDVVVEDPGLPNIIQTIALSVFDTVRVQEGQADSDSLNASVFDGVTITESVATTTNLLRITLFDTVTVLDEPGIFAQGPLGAVTFETVTVQEFAGVYVTLYINAADDVTVVDGALNMDANDAVTVTEDITIRLARLVIDVNDTVTVAEFEDVFGPAVDIGALVFEDVILDESVTVFLTRLVPAVFDDVTVSESVTVSVSSINLSIDVSDTVTVAEAITGQPNPMQINKFTEVLVADVPTLISSILHLSVADTVTVADAVSVELSLILLNVADTVAVTERIAVRIGKGGRKRHDLTILGAGE